MAVTLGPFNLALEIRKRGGGLTSRAAPVTLYVVKRDRRRARTSTSAGRLVRKFGT